MDATDNGRRLDGRRTCRQEFFVTSLRLSKVDSKSYFCRHYKRKCEFYFPCCDKTYRCRFCHDESEVHLIKRENISEVVCSHCNTKQPIQERCQKCDLLFGKYFCAECKLYDDDEKKSQFHCDGCQICRVGNKEAFFHCVGCNMCLPNRMQGKHKCIENLSHTDCPVCKEDIHSSREPSQIPPCQHLIHKSCYVDLLQNNIFNCPTCCKSLVNMEAMWKDYDNVIACFPMPQEYKDVFVEVLCSDCVTTSKASYHFFANKCPICYSYNTVRTKGPYFKKSPDGLWDEWSPMEEDSRSFSSSVSGTS